MFLRFGITRLGGKRRMASSAKMLIMVSVNAHRPTITGPDQLDWILTSRIMIAAGMQPMMTAPRMD
jgi:hypothetical protein